MTLDTHLVLQWLRELALAPDALWRLPCPPVAYDCGGDLAVRMNNPRLQIGEQAVDDFINAHGVLPVGYL